MRIELTSASLATTLHTLCIPHVWCFHYESNVDRTVISRLHNLCAMEAKWSEWQDSNLHGPAPKAGGRPLSHTQKTGRSDWIRTSIGQGCNLPPHFSATERIWGEWWDSHPLAQLSQSWGWTTSPSNSKLVPAERIELSCPKAAVSKTAVYAFHHAGIKGLRDNWGKQTADFLLCRLSNYGLDDRLVKLLAFLAMFRNCRIPRTRMGGQLRAKLDEDT